MTGIVVSSIRHTGTNFTIQLFRNAGWKETHLNSPSLEDRTVYHAHMEKPGQIDRAIELSRRMPLIIPMRHPYMVEESWKRRCQHAPDIYNTANLVSQFRVLEDRFLPFNPFILPVDSPSRCLSLAKIAQATDTVLRTTWQPVASKKETHKLGLEDTEPSKAIVQLIEDMGYFFRKYYALDTKADEGGRARTSA